MKSSGVRAIFKNCSGNEVGLSLPIFSRRLEHLTFGLITFSNTFDKSLALYRKKYRNMLVLCYHATIDTSPENWMKKNWAKTFLYFIKLLNRNTRKKCEISSKLTIKPPGRPHWSCSGVFIANVEHISHHFLVFLLLTSNK